MSENSSVVCASDMAEAIVGVISDYEQRADIGDVLRDLLERAREQSAELACELRNIEAYMPLMWSSADEEAAEAGFDDLEGLIRGEELEALTGRSRLLSAIHRSGIDIRSVYRFSESELRLARSVGAHFAEFMDHLAGFRCAQLSRDPRLGGYTFQTIWSPHLERFLRVLDEEDVIRLKSILVEKNGAWKHCKREWLGTPQADRHFRLFFEVVDQEKCRFLSGDWLTAFVCGIITDHLYGTCEDHEVFAKVSFRAPPDVIRAASDVDVIARLGRKILSFECKSGRLSGDRVDFDALMQKTEDLTSLLDRFLGHDHVCLFFLVFDPTDNDPNQLTAKLTTSSIVPLTASAVNDLIVNALPLD